MENLNYLINKMNNIKQNIKLNFKISIRLFLLVIILTSLNLFFTYNILKINSDGNLLTLELKNAQDISKNIFNDITEKDIDSLTAKIFNEKEFDKYKYTYILVFDDKNKPISHSFIEDIPSELFVYNPYFDDTINHRIKQYDIYGINTYTLIVPIMEGINQIGTLHLGIDYNYYTRTVNTNFNSILKLNLILLIVFIVILIIIIFFSTPSLNNSRKLIQEKIKK
jgi:hypothetical protein